MATVTSASNAPAPTPHSCHNCRRTRVLSPLRRRYSRFPRRIQLLPARRTFSTSTGRIRYQRDIAAKASISLPRSAIETLPITATASSRCRRRPPSTAVPEIRPSSNSSFQTVSLARTLTPSFLTGQSATAKTTTARPTPSKQRSANTAEESRSLLDLSVNADWDETAAELDDIGAVTDDATVVSDADSGIVTAFTDENRDPSSISSTSAERWVTPSGTMASSPWTVGRRSFRR